MRKHTHPPAAQRGASFKPRRARLRGLQFAVLAVVGIAAVGGSVGVTTVITAAPASAATNGAGFGDGSFDTPHIGSYDVNGVDTYCIQPGVAAPYGASTDNGITGSVAGLSATQLSQINYVTSKYGQTNDNVQAAAVSYVVKYTADPQGTIKDLNNSGSTLDSAIQWQVINQGGQGNTDAIKAKASQYLAEAAKVTPGTGTPATGTVSASLVVDKANNFAGALNLDDMTISPASGTITLTNGVFSDTGSATRTGSFSKGQSFKVVGNPPKNTGTGGYKISAKGTFTATSTGSDYAGQVRLFTTGSQQVTVSGAGALNTTIHESFAVSDPTARQVPQVSSKAQQLTSPWADTQDVVTISGPAGAFPPGGVDVVNTAYVAPGLASSTADQQHMTAANTVYTDTRNVTKAGDVTYSIPDLAGKQQDGTHLFWVTKLVWHATGDVLQQSAYNAKGEQTPIKDVVVKTTPEKLIVKPGDSTRDTFTVDGYVPKGMTVIVTQYQVPAGEDLVCTPENQIGPSLNPVTITPGMSNGTKYTTQLTGAQVSGQAGFVEQTFVRGTLVHTAGCEEELFTVSTPETPTTPTTPPATPEKPTKPTTPANPTTPAKPVVPTAVTPAGHTTTLPVVAG